MEAEYRPLETRLSHDTSAVITGLEDHYATSHDAPLDSEQAFNSDALVFEIECARYTTFLTAILIENPTREQQDTVHRAFEFALTLNQLAGIAFERLPLREDFGEVESVMALRDKLAEETSDYMGRHEYLNAVTTYFMPEIDPSSQHNHIAEIVVALTSRQMERHMNERFAAEAWKDWSGTLAELDDMS